MNAPVFSRELRQSTATLTLYALFHLNLAFSSIEEEQRGQVIERCYWPLLRLAERCGPIAIEASGFTLEEIVSRDRLWIEKLQALIQAGKVEFVGSGYAQIIAPLVPARVTEANLALGHEVYQRLLGVKPALALVNEQAWSGGLVGLYLNAGYRGVLMDWDNPSAYHPEWPAETRYRVERALGSDGRTIPLLWTNTVAFQKLQRLAHGDIALAAWLDFFRQRLGEVPRALCCYSNDAEIFDFRPGRYRTEEAPSATSEWERLEQAFAALHASDDFNLVKPSSLLPAVRRQPLRLESAACPVPVKKQRKYNLSRWAVSGRDDVAINAACQRIYDGMCSDPDADWKELCYLWSSDFRTHITEKRWQAFTRRLLGAERRWGTAEETLAPVPLGEAISDRHVTIVTPQISAQLDRRRGLALTSLRFAPHAGAALGSLPHGHFDDIHIQADWYTGDCVFEAPGEHKITDLELGEARIWGADGDTLARARIETPKGPIEKLMRFCGDRPRVEFEVSLDWADLGRGSLRLGHFTLLPDAFDWSKLSLTTHNGGKDPETFALAGQQVDHGVPVSFLVSASHGLGMTEGWAEIGDGATRLRIEVDRSTAPLLGMLTHRCIGGSLFCQFVLSALELDDTRKPTALREGPRRYRFAVGAA